MTTTSRAVCPNRISMMYKVTWSPSDFSTIVTRWFHGRDAALRFARTRYVAVLYGPDGNRIKFDET